MWWVLLISYSLLPYGLHVQTILLGIKWPWFWSTGSEILERELRGDARGLMVNCTANYQFLLHFFLLLSCLQCRGWQGWTAQSSQRHFLHVLVHPSYSPSSSSNSPSSSAVASWYCWYSETKSFMLDSASVNSISSIPSPVYQCKKALRGSNIGKMCWESAASCNEFTEKTKHTFNSHQFTIDRYWWRQWRNRKCLANKELRSVSIPRQSAFSTQLHLSTSLMTLLSYPVI